jgi:hypothetical protein
MASDYLAYEINQSNIGNYTNSGNDRQAVINSVDSRLFRSNFYDGYQIAANNRIVQLDSNHVGHLPALTEVANNYGSRSCLALYYIAPRFRSWNMTQGLPTFVFDLRVVINSTGLTRGKNTYIFAKTNNGNSGLKFTWDGTADNPSFYLDETEIPALKTGWITVKIQCTNYGSDNYSAYADVYVDNVLIKSDLYLNFITSETGFFVHNLSSVSTWADEPSHIEIGNLKVYLRDEFPSPPVIETSQETFIGAVKLSASATVDPSLEDQSVTWLWSTGETTSSIIISESGTYTVTATDTAGESSTVSVTVSDFYKLPVPLQSGYQISHQPNIIRTEMMDKHFRQRYSDVVKHSELSCRFLMLQSELDTWIEKWRNDLFEGAEWFYLKTLTGVKSVRLKNGEFEYSLHHNSDTTLYEVSMKLEVKE